MQKCTMSDGLLREQREDAVHMPFTVDHQLVNVVGVSCTKMRPLRFSKMKINMYMKIKINMKMKIRVIEKGIREIDNTTRSKNKNK